MTMRGSICSEYIYCGECFKSLKEYFEKSKDRKYLNLLQIEDYPILAGKIGGMYGGEENHEFEFNILPELEKLVCADCKIYFVVLAESREPQSFVVKRQN